MVRGAFIKDNKCNNVVVFNTIEDLNNFKQAITPEWLVDDLIVIPDGFGIDDIYVNGQWLKKPEPEFVYVPTTDDRILALEETVNFLLGL